MLVRDRFEKEYRSVYERFGTGTTTWGPIAGGILTGKYNDGNIPEDSQRGNSLFFASRVAPLYFSETTKAKTVKTLQAIGEIAKELGYT
jgi:aryl-alcohol dehydrogenase-like predicted oxidoreductase